MRPLFVVYISLCLLLSGCIPILIGAGGVAGYLATKDTALGNVETSFDKLWSTALKVAEESGDITEENDKTGLIKATSGRNSITIVIKELTEHSYSLRVTCRKSMALANLSLAQSLFTKIVRRIK
jgi:hypothetical protein